MYVLICKSDSKLMKVLAWLSRPFWPDFIHRGFITIGSTIYYPERYRNAKNSLEFQTALDHEARHVDQYKMLTVPGFLFFYLLFPLPVLFTGRWFLARGPYLGDIKAGVFTVDEVVSILWRQYLWPWPRSLMRAWFEKELEG